MAALVGVVALASSTSMGPASVPFVPEKSTVNIAATPEEVAKVLYREESFWKPYWEYVSSKGVGSMPGDFGSMLHNTMISPNIIHLGVIPKGSTVEGMYADFDYSRTPNGITLMCKGVADMLSG